EPLSDLSWQRIERRLMAHLGEEPASGGAGEAAGPSGGGASRRRALVASVAAAAVAAAAANAIAVWPGGGAPGDGEGGRAPSRIATTDAPSAVSVGVVSLEVAPRSALLVDDGRERGVLVVLERGAVTCRVAARPRRAPVVVVAGDVRIEVTGTVFSVSRDGDS